MPEIKYPHITIELTGERNPYALLHKVIVALRDAGVPDDEVTLFIIVATHRDYDHMVRVVRQFVTVID